MIPGIQRKKRKKCLFSKGLFALFAGVSALLICALAIVVLPEQKAYAYDEITQIEVTVSFLGGKKYTKADPTISEIENDLSMNRVIYTAIRGNGPSTIEAEGVYVSDLLEYCGVDMSSVDRFNFETLDGYEGSSVEWTYPNLFGPRYAVTDAFFRVIEDFENSDPEDYALNPEYYYTITDVYDFETECYRPSVWSSRSEVDPMLALYYKRTNWNSYIRFTVPSKLDYAGMETSGTPVLFYGQASASESSSHDMAKWVHKVNILYEGSPEISVENTPIEGKAGTESQIVVHVSTPDEALTNAIISELVYESSDTSVATVSRDGRVMIEGAGTASISVSYNGQVYGSVGATGSKNDEEEVDPGDGDGEGPGGGGGGGGSGSGSGGGSGSGSGKGGSKGSTGKDKSGQSGRQTGGTSSGKSTGITVNKRTAKNVVPTGGVASGKVRKKSDESAKEGGSVSAGGGEQITQPDKKVYEHVDSFWWLICSWCRSIDRKLEL